MALVLDAPEPDVTPGSGDEQSALCLPSPRRQEEKGVHGGRGTERVNIGTEEL